MADHFPLHHVLVLDDDEIMHHLLGALLAGEGFEIAKAASGEEALRHLRAGLGADLILTDLNMPGLEGRALAEALRETRQPATLLIGMSGTEPSAETRAPLDAFLLKPFDLDSLRAAIASARERNGAAQVASAASSAGATGDPGTPLVLDEVVFQSLAKMIPPAKLGELFTMMLADIEKRRIRIETAAAEGNLEAAQREAHAIKGSCGMVGALEMQALAAALESGTTLDVAALHQIPAASERLRRMLNSKLHTA